MNYALKHYLLSKTRTYEQNTKGKRKNSMNFEKNKNIISPPIRRSCSGGGGGFGPRSPHQSRRQVPGTSAGMTEVSGEPAALGTLPESDRDWEMTVIISQSDSGWVPQSFSPMAPSFMPADVPGAPTAASAALLQPLNSPLPKACLCKKKKKKKKSSTFTINLFHK